MGKLITIQNNRRVELIDVPEGKVGLKTLQEQVGGYIETVDLGLPFKECAAFCNEEGKLLGMEPTVIILDESLAPIETYNGPIVIAYVEPETDELLPFSDESAEWVKEILLFNYRWHDVWINESPDEVKKNTCIILQVQETRIVPF
ncbi:MAG: DUF3846 domain-containing protein [Fastidiosipilaceae bacterium]|jgi:hypothetical protein